eukprot:CAMPEP_0197860268 /NCGR_PEP_ID=MMETSP1438-20131217/35522_1 /TAXON_ID=1461541 /ORGANISM="Pterosperma sp., Strain CCMP1384" /LENGTH=268 /DNA_ID=CAMNT_0043477067 /DNA_START=42 /DNA_END=848 /DNA_ORIENTATION=-
MADGARIRKAIQALRRFDRQQIRAAHEAKMKDIEQKGQLRKKIHTRVSVEGDLKSQIEQEKKANRVNTYDTLSTQWNAKAIMAEQEAEKIARAHMSVMSRSTSATSSRQQSPLLRSPDRTPVKQPNPEPVQYSKPSNQLFGPTAPETIGDLMVVAPPQGQGVANTNGEGGEGGQEVATVSGEGQNVNTENQAAALPPPPPSAEVVVVEVQPEQVTDGSHATQEEPIAGANMALSEASFGRKSIVAEASLTSGTSPLPVEAAPPQVEDK